MSDVFRTFQTVQRYEDALLRHAQWLRWISGITCPCLTPETGQPDPHCPLCRGRGKLYKSPRGFKLFNESAPHDGFGKVKPRVTPVIPNSVTVYRHGSVLPLDANQPADGSYVKLAPPYPKAWQVLTMDYEYDPDIAVVSENSQVYGPNLLRVQAPLFSEKGKTFEGSIKTVTRVYNVTRDELYTVSTAFKVFIYLQSMGTWESGDVLEVDYVYQRPYPFMLIGITPKIRYQQPYVLEMADAILITPYWAQVAPDDLFTAMAVEQTGRAVVNPEVSSGGNDVIGAYYDLSRILRVVTRSGHEYNAGPGKDVEIFERNELRWNVTKPAVPYTVQFTYHPTYTALDQMHTLRNSENKAFANRISVKQFDRVHDRIQY